jgi:CubicO group peptidase (beta-lactamase class C family)
MRVAISAFRGCLLFVGTAVTLDAQAVSPCRGVWTGAIQIPGSPLAFETKFTDTNGTCTATISIPAQGAKDLPLANVLMRADSARFTINGVPGAPTFAGAREASGERISGRFTQGGGSFPFTMATGGAAAAVSGDSAKAALRGFDAWVDSTLAAWKVVGLSIGISINGETVYLKGHGLRDLERKLPVTPQTLFAIGSSSKAFTTFAMGALVDQGRLQWDVPVRTYLPWFRMHTDDASRRLTPRDLVTHRSGLPRHDLVWYNNTGSTREELVRRLAYLPLNKDLRETFQYNNLMYLTAGYLVGSVVGTSWEDAVRSLVMTPAGMTRTNFSVAASQADTDFSFPYTLRRDTIQKLPFRDISLVGPAGSINSSAEDMLKWMSIHLTGGRIGTRQVLQPATLKDMYRPYTPISGIGDDPEFGPMSYGLGWFVDSYRGHYRAQHGGNIDGFTAAVTLLPTDRIGIVVLVNQNGSAVGELITRHALDRLFSAPRRDWSGDALAKRKLAQSANAGSERKAAEMRIPNAPPARKLAAYVGTYADSGYGTLAITMERDTLAMTYNGISARLQPWHFETFTGLRNPADPTFEGIRVTFRNNAAGHISGLDVRLEPFVAPIVFERQPDARLRDSSVIARFVGRYQIPGGPVAVITQRGSTLFYSQGAEPMPLEPQDGTRFVLAAVKDVSVEFTVDASGKVTGARVAQPGAVTDITRLP